MYACLNTCLSTCLLAVFMSISLSAVWLSASHSAYRSVYLPVCLSICLFFGLHIFLSACLSAYTPFLLPVCLPACLSTYLATLSVWLSTCRFSFMCPFTSCLTVVLAVKCYFLTPHSASVSFPVSHCHLQLSLPFNNISRSSTLYSYRHLCSCSHFQITLSQPHLTPPRAPGKLH